ncbi:F0F1 ATP synthase subunit epsilon [Candidatus Parabeggiatoa sp. HSG14]|uniref:F0F1 ATP synthase subunit epsilon n=1 Tax=Candidatus Parabeggiatoa sp. HSG14 TaxID=3055593 RepID=UPI0025A809FF|nr:F0F1 ATP synthase subunit epsilon [Thiotrichales bacterium HSG14]
MTMTVHVDIVSAEAEIFSGLAEMVIAPAVQGEVGIMPRHAQYITQLNEGAIRLKLSNNKEESFYVSGGMLEVQPHKITVLSDTALRAHDLDEKAALEAKQNAEKLLTDKQAGFECAKAQAELADAMLQLRAIEKFRKIKK